MMQTTRREFLKASASAAMVAVGPAAYGLAAKTAADMQFGLVTYQWGKDWDLPTLIANCTKTGALGVELRTTHAHGVEPSLSAAQRKEVRKQFADSSVTLVGLGTAENLHYPEPEKHAKAVETSKAFIKLSHDVGGSGVKVRPNDLPKGVPQEKTIAQISKALNELGAFGADYAQQIRLEVHGGCARLPIIKQIMDGVSHPNVGVCWNSNKWDLDPPGLEYNFNLVARRFGDTVHVRPFDSPDYPWADLVRLLMKMDYRGWVLLEAGTKVDDRVAALAEQARSFADLVARAKR